MQKPLELSLYNEQRVGASWKKKNTPVLCYLFFLLLFMIVSFVEPSKVLLSVLAIIDLIITTAVIVTNYRKTGIIFSPLNAICITWGILIPASSFEFPAMENMSAFSWNRCLITEIIGLFVCLLFQKDAAKKKEDFVITRSEEICLTILLILSVASIAYSFSRIGFSGPSNDSVSSLRTEEFFPGFNIVSNLGTVCVPPLLINKNKRFKKTVIAISALYLLLLLISAIRFALVLCLILLFSYYVFVKKRHLKIIFVLGVFILVAFLFANFIRRGNDSVVFYFINTGIYSGTVREFNSTEVFRYIGYSQRLMDLYMNSNPGGTNNGLFTLYPILRFFFVEPELVSIGSIYGYNANNIITILYADFGIFWPLAVFAFFSICIACYNWKIRTNSFVASYFWSVALFALLFSFYAYVFQYVYWVTIYPLALVAIHLVFGGVKNV